MRRTGWLVPFQPGARCWQVWERVVESDFLTVPFLA
jgi:hypothetical protein